MSNSDLPWIELTIRTQEDATELFLFDGQLRLVASAPGHLAVSVPLGVYLVKARIGFTTEDHELVLDGSEPKKEFTLPPVKYATPAPIPDTASWSPSLEEVVQRARQDVVQGVGEAGALFFTRPLHPADAERSPTTAELLEGEWGPLANDGTQTFLLFLTSHAANDHYWFGTHSRPSGPYISRFVGPNRRVVERLLFLVPGWALHDFSAAPPILSLDEGREVYLAGDGESACSYASASQPFSSENPSARVEDIARLALTHDRLALSPPLFDDILGGRFESPMLGLYCAHLALRHRDRTKRTPELKPAIKRLQSMLGADHPDVAALTLAVGELPEGYQFHFPPMLAASWQLILDASARRPNLVPRDSFAARIADRVCGDGPWLLWESDAPHDWSNLPASVQAWLTGTDKDSKTLEAVKPAPKDTGLDLLDSVLVDALRREKVTPVGLRDYVARPDDPSAARKIEPAMPKLVRASGLPRSRIEERLEALLPEPGDRFDPTARLGNKILWYTPREAWESMWQVTQLSGLDLLASVAGGDAIDLTRPSDIYATCLAEGTAAAWRWTTFEVEAGEPVCLIDLATGADLLRATTGDRAVSFDTTTGVVSVDTTRLPDREWQLFALGAGSKLTATRATNRAVFAVRREPPPPVRARDAAGLVAAGHLLAGWQVAITRGREWPRPGLSWLVATAFARMQVLLNEVAKAPPHVAEECRFVLSDLVSTRETRVDALKQGVWDAFKDEP